MLKTLLCTGLLAATAVGRPHFDKPDLRLEAELHRQFLRLQSGDPSFEKPSPLAPDAYVEDYRIQKGETLWSMSEVLYGDGAYWPRVWAQNQNVGNPALVRPGHTLQFLMGSEDDTPAFRFTEEGGEGGVELASANGSNPVIEIPPPEIPPKPVLKVPLSFPEWQNVYRRPPKPIIDDRGLEYRRNKVPDRIFLRAYVEEKPVEPEGYFLENDREAGLPVINQYVYIKVKKGTGSVGAKMIIVHDAGKIRTVIDEFENDVPAFLVQVAGELQLTEPAEAKFRRSSDNEKFDVFRALITKTTGLSLTNNFLVTGTMPLADLTPSGPHGSTVTEIVGSEKHVSSMLYGQGDIVFLNRGSSSGVQVGMLLDLYTNRRSRHSDTPVPFSPVPSGKLKVVRVTDSLATAVILSAHDGIMQGDSAKEVSLRANDREKFSDPDLNFIEGGEIHEDPDNLMTDPELDKELNQL